MQHCILCILALAFLITSIVTPFVAQYSGFGTTKKEVIRAFTNTLNDKQKRTYEKIIIHRRNVYLEGLLLGLAFACVCVLIVLHTQPLSNTWVYGCLGVFVLFITTFLYYILTPKPEYMVSILTSKKQNKAWIKVYRHMQVVMYGSFTCALVASFLICSYAVC